MNCGAPSTVTDAVAAVPPFPDSVDEVALVTLFLMPAEGAITLPRQLLASPLGVATTRPPGRLSLKLMLVSVVPALGLLIDNVSDVVCPMAMLAAPNCWATHLFSRR